MAEAHAEELTLQEWSGGVSPYEVNHKKLGMWLFIVSDALTFSAILIGYSYLRMATPHWPTPFHLWPSIAVSALMTFFLLSSSLTMVFAVNASQRNESRRTIVWLGFTMLFGILFMLLHANEWKELIHEGLTLASNPWAKEVPLFGATFFGITGLHMFHVFTGVLYIAVISIGIGRKRFNAEHVEVCGLYWHFVDLVWMFVFPLIYLMSVKMH